MTAMKQGRYLSTRPAVLGLAKVLVLALGQVPLVQAVPLHLSQYLHTADKVDPKPADDPSLWIYLSVAAVLVLLGGAFAGLTIALMGQDEITLQVLIASGEGSEKKSADKVLNLLKRGKHWVLVTLLLSNVITNETLPIVLDRSLGGGWPAVLGSTVLIVIFGEIVPQSICVRYGLPIGAWMAPFVLGLMYLMSPVAWPTAKLLDWLLGEEHGTTYKKAGLKTLVSLHRNLGEVGNRLHADEVTIISAVLDLKEKSIGSIMTPMDDVFTLSLDDVLDESTVNDILAQGYSRIPVHHPDNEENFVGMLLVKMLISYDPEDAKPVRDFALATLPETRPNTSCLDIINFFQEGKSHMVLVSESPGTDHGAMGVVTLEDVIEELIGEEIVDESDVFVDVHRAIRRLQPAPRNRVPHQVVTSEEITSVQVSKAVVGELVNIDEDEVLKSSALQKSATHDELLKQKPTQRRPSGHSASVDKKSRLSTNMEEAREHAKHLGPSNLASRPKTTRFQSIKIKPGAEGNILSATHSQNGRMTPVRQAGEYDGEYGHGIGEGQLKSAGLEASDGVQALREDYGTVSASPDSRRPRSTHKATQANGPNEEDVDENSSLLRPTPQTHPSEDGDTVGELGDNNRSRSPMAYNARGPARSGSITENIVDTNGIRKVVLETTSSSDSEDQNDGGSKKSDKSSPRIMETGESTRDTVDQADVNEGDALKKRRRRKKRTGKKEAESPS